MELSQRELQKVKVIENAVQGRITVAEASSQGYRNILSEALRFRKRVLEMKAPH